MRPSRALLAVAALSAGLALAAGGCQKQSGPAPARVLEYEILTYRDASTPLSKTFEVDLLIAPWEDTSDVKRTILRAFADLSQGELKVRPGYAESSYKRADAAPGPVEIIRAQVYDAKPAEPHNRLCLAQWVSDVDASPVPEEQRDTAIRFLSENIYIDWNPDKLAARLK